MRIRATVAAVSGALALTALAVPAAQADDSPAGNKLSTFAVNAPADEHVGDTKIKKVTVNGGKSIVLGTSAKKKITVAVTANDPSGIDDAYGFLYHGPDRTHADGALTPAEQGGASCHASSRTTSTCKFSITIDPQVDLRSNTLAGSWKVFVGAGAKDGDYIFKDNYKTAHVKRLSKLATTNASPEPVVRGEKITVTSALTRANWETHTYKGYTAQPVKLQFKKAGSSSYSTVKTVTSSSTGALSTTVTAASDGTWRYSFAGTSTSPAVTATGDTVDVR